VNRLSPRHSLRARPHPARLSIVIPHHKEEEVIPDLRRALTAFAERHPFAMEFVLVNDGSTDATLGLLSDWATEDSRVRLLCFARNFGHEAAVIAGLDYARGDAVVVMDADLQDPPEVIDEMIAGYMRGYDVVYGRRLSRDRETAFKRVSAWLFYRTMRTLVYRDLPPDTGDFRLISRRCLEAIKSMREAHRFLRGLAAWVGFPQTEVLYRRMPRQAGTTKYSLRKMLQLAWTAAMSFSPAPLRFSFAAGIAAFLAGLGEGAITLVRSVSGPEAVPAWGPSVIAICLVGGAILISIGIVGEYIARIFEQGKARPLYIVSETIGVDSHEPAIGAQLDRLRDATRTEDPDGVANGATQIAPASRTAR
jgi:dolichol-phosphate mannosyltransferase